MTSKFVCFSIFLFKLIQALVYTLQNLFDTSWEEMLLGFKRMVSRLYLEWEDCLIQSLKPVEWSYFESICLKTATNSDLRESLFMLSCFLTQKFDQKVIVLIDEYEVPNVCAFDYGYLKIVCSLYILLYNY